MNGDPKIWRVVGLCLLTLYIVCLVVMGRVPTIVWLPTLLFFVWRWRVRRKLDHPGPRLVLAQPVKELDVIDAEFEVLHEADRGVHVSTMRKELL